MERRHRRGHRVPARAPTRCGATTARPSGRPSPTAHRAASSRAATSRPPATARSRTSTSTPTACRARSSTTWGEARRGVPRRARRRRLRPAQRARLRRDRAGDDILPARPLLRPGDRRDPRRGRPADRLRRAQHPLVGARLRQRPARPGSPTTPTSCSRRTCTPSRSRWTARSASRRSSRWSASSSSPARRPTSYGMPLWSGEYGYWGDDADRVERLSRYADARGRVHARQRLLGVEAGLRRPAGRHQRHRPTRSCAQDCATGDDAPAARRPARDPEPRLPAQRARRAHRRSSADGARCRARRHHRRRAAADSRCGSPARPSPTCETTGITEVETTAVPGGWIVTGCAEGDYTLSTNG